jgi:valyl-tRNA synthetase
MVMLSLALCKTLPFKTVYLHAMVRDKDGRKMSKSLGNVIDPVEVIEGRDLEYLVAKLKEGNLAASEVRAGWLGSAGWAAQTLTCARHAVGGGQVKMAERGLRENFKDGLPECGTDALRFGLLAYTSQGRDVNLDVHRVLAYRQFCNKLWQIARFCAGLVDKFGQGGGEAFASRQRDFRPTAVRDRWILSRLARCVLECDAGMREFQFSRVTSALHGFWLYELADVYVEACKPLFRDGGGGGGSSSSAHSLDERRDALDTLYLCLDWGLRLMHPSMPFVTEELWQRMAGHPADRPESLVVAAYPSPADVQARALLDVAAEEDFGLVTETARCVRNILSKLPPTSKTLELDCVVDGGGADLLLARVQRVKVCARGGAPCQALARVCVADACLHAQDDIGTLSRTSVRVVDKARPGQTSVAVVLPGLSVAVHVDGLVDVEQEVAKLDKKRGEVQASIEDMSKRLAGEDYSKKAKPEVKAKDAARLEELQVMLATLEQELGRFKKAAA